MTESHELSESELLNKIKELSAQRDKIDSALKAHKKALQKLIRKL